MPIDTKESSVGRTEKMPIARLTVDVSEAAIMLGIHPNSVYGLVREHRLPTLKLGLRKIVIPRAAIERLVAETPDSTRAIRLGGE